LLYSHTQVEKKGYNMEALTSGRKQRERGKFGEEP
jgi:hypothetical protein